MRAVLTGYSRTALPGQIVYASVSYIVLRVVPAAQADEQRVPYLKQARTAGESGALAPLRLCELAGYLHDRGPDKAKAQKLFQEALSAGAPPSCACELLSKMKAPPAAYAALQWGSLADGNDGAADRTQWSLAHCATETGFGLEELGKTAEAEKYYRLTVALQPDDVVHISNLATFVMDVHKNPAGRKEAKDLLTRAYAAPRGDTTAKANVACNLAIFDPTASNAADLMREALARDAEAPNGGDNGEPSQCVANYKKGAYARIAGVPQNN